jgi:hypothetical protein
MVACHEMPDDAETHRAASRPGPMSFGRAVHLKGRGGFDCGSATEFRRTVAVGKIVPVEFLSLDGVMQAPGNDQPAAPGRAVAEAS